MQHESEYDQYFSMQKPITQEEQQLESRQDLKHYRRNNNSNEVADDAQSDSTSVAPLNQELFQKKRYVPVAMVMETETEYHDFFKQLMLALFDLIRVPPEYCPSGTTC